MTKYRVYLGTRASLTVTAEVPDDLDEDDAVEAAIDTAYEGQEIRPERVDGAS